MPARTAITSVTMLRSLRRLILFGQQECGHGPVGFRDDADFAPGGSFREARSAIGASTVLLRAQEYNSVAEAVADCTLVVGTTAVRHRRLRHPLRRLEYGARMIRKQLGSSSVALLFGSEKSGLSNEDFSHCHWLMRIPTCEQNISMNLGQAVAVCLYEIVRDVKASRQTEKQMFATAGEYERITTCCWTQCMRAAT